MTKLYFLVALTCLSLCSYSQMRLGILGGPHSSNVKESNSTNSGYSAKSGLNLGVLIDIPLSEQVQNRWFLQPGIFYTAKGRKFYQRYPDSIAIITDTISSSNKFSSNYIDIPVNLTYKLPIGKNANLMLSAGPYLSFFYGGKQEFETRLSDSTFKSEDLTMEAGKIDGKVNTFDAGINFRAGFELGNFLLTGFMSRGLTNFYHGSPGNTYKHQVTGVSLGFWLGKAKKPVSKATPITPVTVQKDTAAAIIVKDTDGDGIRDEEDSCPTEAGTAEFNGCPVPDMDGDGLNDLEDKCPQEAGPTSNDGCPEPQKDTVQKEVVDKLQFAARSILFGANSNILTKASEAPLDEVAAILHANPSYKLTIEGHTDATGSATNNKKLSSLRADAVKNYLVKKGVEEYRLIAQGLGSEKPIADESTAEGRSRNRRVELKLSR